MSEKNSETKNLLEDVEQFSLSSCETVNEKLEDIKKKLQDLTVELEANIKLVHEKRHMCSKDLKQFIRDLGEDVREFLQYMKEELDPAIGAISEREQKCRKELSRIEELIRESTNTKSQI